VSGNAFDWGQREKLKAEMGKQVGLQTRSINRYLRVLQCPFAVQQAFDRGEIKLETAGQISFLPTSTQEQIAQRLSSGEAAATVIADHCAKTDGRHKRASNAFVCFARDLERGAKDMDGRVESISPASILRWMTVIRRAKEIIDALIAKAEAAQRDGPIDDVFDLRRFEKIRSQISPTGKLVSRARKSPKR
jgi:hypothetical protein